MDARHTRDGRQPFQYESLQILAVVDNHLEQVVVIASDMVALQYFRHLADGSPHRLYLLRLVQLQADLHEAQHIEASLLTVEQGGVLANIALLFQAAQAGMRGGRGEVDPPGKLGVAQAAFFLQDLQDEFVG